MDQIGALLRQTRELKNIAIAQVEEETKIRAKYLLALEAGQYEQIPGPVYVKGFLRTYANYLALDSNALVEQARAILEPPADPKGRTAAALVETREGPAPKEPKTPPAPKPIARQPALPARPGYLSRALVPVLAGLLVVAVGFGAWYLLKANRAEPGLTPPVQTPPQPAPVNTTPTPITPTPSQTPAAAQVDAQPVKDGVWSIAVKSADHATVKIALPHKAWMQVMADGKPANSESGDTYAEGKEVTFTATQDLVIRLGWPEALKLTVNGKELPAITYTGSLDIKVTLVK